MKNMSVCYIVGSAIIMERRILTGRTNGVKKRRKQLEKVRCFFDAEGNDVVIKIPRVGADLSDLSIHYLIAAVEGAEGTIFVPYAKLVPVDRNLASY